MEEVQGLKHATAWNVDSIEREGPEAVRVKASCSGAENAFHHPGPGGYCAFLLPTEPKIKRTYSVLSKPGAPQIEFLVKNVRGGLASRFFHTEAEPGQTLEMVNSGNHLWQSHWNQNPQHFIAFAGGIGISPIYSCLIHALEFQSLNTSAACTTAAHPSGVNCCVLSYLGSAAIRAARCSSCTRIA